jgi:hypothetical protein
MISKLGVAHDTIKEYGSEEGVVYGPITLCNDNKCFNPSA